jgi:nucleotide-binding universal stress UspA family protein
MKKILVAIDDSDASEKVAAAALDIGKPLEAEVTLLSVVDTNFIVTDGVVTPQEIAESIHLALKKNQLRIIEKSPAGNKVKAHVEQGKPWEVIIEKAKNWGADLIVIGTHGRTGLKYLLMGSVAEKVLRHSTLPVLIIPVNKEKEKEIRNDLAEADSYHGRF